MFCYFVAHYLHVIQIYKIIGDKYNLVPNNENSVRRKILRLPTIFRKAEPDISRKVRNFKRDPLNNRPFRYQGQYEDVETELYYNRFRYYDPSSGNYLNQDPRLGWQQESRIFMPINDTNTLIDEFGLSPKM